MSRPWEKAGPSRVSPPKKKILVHALSLCAHMEPEGREFIYAIPLSSESSPPDLTAWVERGWVTRGEKWGVLTPEGNGMRGSPKISPSDRAWLEVLRRIPSYDALSLTERGGIITNVGGFPVLTPLGEVAKIEISKQKEYFRTHPGLLEGSDFPDEGGDPARIFPP